MSSIRSTIQLITSNFPSLLIVFRPLFTRIALGDVDLRFSLISATHASAVKLHQPLDYTTNVVKPHTGLMGLTSFSASLQHNATQHNTRQVWPRIVSADRFKPKFMASIRNVVYIFKSR
jgi:hypothetical protein